MTTTTNTHPFRIVLIAPGTDTREERARRYESKAEATRDATRIRGEVRSFQERTGVRKFECVCIVDDTMPKGLEIVGYREIYTSAERRAAKEG